MTKLELRLERDGGELVIFAPGPGVWTGAPAAGRVLVAGQGVGSLEVLGRRLPLSLPAGAGGRVIEVAGGGRDLEVAVDFDTPLLRLDPEVGGVAVAADERRESSEAGLVFRSPSSGRYYSRPGPGKPSFVNPGDAVATGDTVCLLEVMKTFSRIRYGGDGLPERARVVAIRPGDEDDLDEGDVILELEAIAE